MRHMVQLHPVVLQHLVEKASESGASSVSQYCSDVLAFYVGMPEHVRELNQTPIVSAARKIGSIQGDATGRIMVRPHREVSERLTQQAGSPRGHVTPYIADILATHVGRLDLVRHLDKGGVPLAM